MIASNGPEQATNRLPSFLVVAPARIGLPDRSNRASLFSCYQAGKPQRAHWDAACSDSVTWQTG